MGIRDQHETDLREHSQLAILGHNPFKLLSPGDLQGGKYEWAGQREAGDCSLRILRHFSDHAFVQCFSMVLIKVTAS
jgi:hypothetical protein